jgi:DNA-binding transcriptional regulator YiaG
VTKPRHPSQWERELLHESCIADFTPIPGASGYRINRDGKAITNTLRHMPEGYWGVIAIGKSNVARRNNRVKIKFDNQKSATFHQLGRILLITFVGPSPGPDYCAGHRNGITDDDRVENLVWATAQELTHGRICRGTWAHGEKSPTARHSLEQVEAARKIVTEFGVSTNLLATAMGMSQSHVRNWMVNTWDASKWDGLENPLLASLGSNPCGATFDQSASGLVAAES